MIIFFLIFALLIPTAVLAGCPEDLMATAEYGKIVNESQQDLQQRLAVAHAKLVQMERLNGKLNKELQDLKKVIEGNKTEPKADEKKETP